MPQNFLLQEMAEQRALVARVLETSPAFIDRALALRFGRSLPRRVLFAGCGDMRFAARAAAAFGRSECGLAATALPAMDLRWEASGLGPGDLCVVASISGRTPRALEALHLAAAAGAAVLAVTDDPEGPLARAAGEPLLLGTSPPADLLRSPYAGYARPVPQTKTFAAALAALLAVAARAAGKAAPPAAGCSAAIEVAERSAEVHAPVLAAEHFAECQRYFVLGSGAAAALAGYGAAKLLEYAIDARAQCIEEFQHLELFVAGPGAGVVMLAHDRRAAERIAELTQAYDELGVRTLVLGCGGPYPGAAARQVQCAGTGLAAALFGLAVHLQRFAFEVAARLGRDVDAWVGGERGELIARLSPRLIRQSRICADPAP